MILTMILTAKYNTLEHFISWHKDGDGVKRLEF